MQKYTFDNRLCISPCTLLARPGTKNAPPAPALALPGQSNYDPSFDIQEGISSELTNLENMDLSLTTEVKCSTRGVDEMFKGPTGKR